MQAIFLLIFPYLLENIFYINIIRKFNKQKTVCKLLPSIFTNFLKIIISSFFSKRKNKTKNSHLIFLVFIFESFACLNAFHSSKVSNIYYAVAMSSKFIFIGLLSYFVLKKKFSVVQLLGQGVILVSIFFGAIKQQSKSTETQIYSFMAVVCSGFISSIGNVYFERYIKNDIVDFHTYNMEYSSIHLFVSMFTSSVEIILCGLESVGNTINSTFFNHVLISVLHTYLLTYMSTKMEPVIRSFLLLVTNSIACIAIDFMEIGRLNGNALITLLFVNVGIVLYEIENLKKLYNRSTNK